MILFCFTLLTTVCKQMILVLICFSRRVYISVNLEVLSKEIKVGVLTSNVNDVVGHLVHWPFWLIFKIAKKIRIDILPQERHISFLLSMNIWDRHFRKGDQGELFPLGMTKNYGLEQLGLLWQIPVVHTRFLPLKIVVTVPNRDSPLRLCSLQSSLQ